jgi:hypothetical protein
VNGNTIRYFNRIFIGVSDSMNVNPIIYLI